MFITGFCKSILTIELKYREGIVFSILVLNTCILTNVAIIFYPDSYIIFIILILDYYVYKYSLTIVILYSHLHKICNEKKAH